MENKQTKDFRMARFFMLQHNCITKTKVKYIIIGAGPAGLAFAATLKMLGERSFVVLEKDNEAGGLCRSVICNGAPLDFGGGHILDARKKNVLVFLFSYMPENEWNFYERNTKIAVSQHTVNYPFEANIWQFPMEEQIDYLESIAKAALFPKEKPTRFADWIYWKFGDKIAESYMLPYNRKIWSIDINELGTYWLNKLPDVSFRDTLRSCLGHAFYGALPAHTQFYYPKKTGYGEVFLRIADSLNKYIHYGYCVNELDIKHTSVNGGDFTANYIINTAPWQEFAATFPKKIKKLTETLLYSSVDVDYYDEPSNTDAHWTYYADETLPYHRKIHRDNIIAGSKGFWTETNSKRRKIMEGGGGAHFENKYAYPLNTIAKPETIKKLLITMERHHIFGLGRWGEWEHYNSDVVIERGIRLAQKLMEIN
jgi:protoporphyrinogen oxidase